MSNRGITVINVCRALGIEPTPAVTWAVGAQVRDAFERETGQAPPKELRQKTSGAGSHCFAVYPESMRPTIERLLRESTSEAQRQGELF